MPATLTDCQLKAALTNEQILAARTKGVSAADSFDPVLEEITAALAKVDAYAAGYDAPAGLLTGWAKELAAHGVAKRLGAPTEDQVRTYERTLKELEDLRDGKFPGIPRLAAPTTGKIVTGSRQKVL